MSHTLDNNDDVDDDIIQEGEEEGGGEVIVPDQDIHYRDNTGPIRGGYHPQRQSDHFVWRPY